MTAAASRRDLFWQLVRYAINGGLITVLYAIVYWLVLHLTALSPQWANVAGFLVAVVAGYVVHSQVTFRGHGGRSRGTKVRFVIASFMGYAVNAFWVWLVTAHLHLPEDMPLIPIVFVTPIMLFAVNRWWVFR